MMEPVITLFLFTVRQTLLSRKVILSLLLLASPAALILMIRIFGPVPQREAILWEEYNVSAQYFLISGLIPLMCMMHGTSLIGADIEARTIVYLITRRLRRGSVLLVKFFAVAVVLAVLSNLAMLLLHTVTLSGLDLTSPIAHTPSGQKWGIEDGLLCYLMVIPLAVTVFLAVFTFAGMVVKRPLHLSIAYFFFVELVISNIEFAGRTYSILHQIRSILTEHSREYLFLFHEGSGIGDMESFFPKGDSGLPEVIIITAIALALSYTLMTMRELMPAKVARD